MSDKWDQFAEPSPSGDKWDQYAEKQPGFGARMVEGSSLLSALADPIGTLKNLTGFDHIQKAMDAHDAGDNGTAALRLLQFVSTNPATRAADSLIAVSKDQFGKAFDAFKKKDYDGAIVHVNAGLAPIIAPAANGTDLIKAGDIAGGSGLVAGNILDFATPYAAEKLKQGAVSVAAKTKAMAAAHPKLASGVGGAVGGTVGGIVGHAVPIPGAGPAGAVAGAYLGRQMGGDFAAESAAGAPVPPEAPVPQPTGLTSDPGAARMATPPPIPVTPQSPYFPPTSTTGMTPTPETVPPTAGAVAPEAASPAPPQATAPTVPTLDQLAKAIGGKDFASLGPAAKEAVQSAMNRELARAGVAQPPPVPPSANTSANVGDVAPRVAPTPPTPPNEAPTAAPEPPAKPSATVQPPGAAAQEVDALLKRLRTRMEERGIAKPGEALGGDPDPETRFEEGDPNSPIIDSSKRKASRSMNKPAANPHLIESANLTDAEKASMSGVEGTAQITESPAYKELLRKSPAKAQEYLKNALKMRELLAK